MSTSIDSSTKDMEEECSGPSDAKEPTCITITVNTLLGGMFVLEIDPSMMVSVEIFFVLNLLGCKPQRNDPAHPGTPRADCAI